MFKGRRAFSLKQSPLRVNSSSSSRASLDHTPSKRIRLASTFLTSESKEDNNFDCNALSMLEPIVKTTSVEPTVVELKIQPTNAEICELKANHQTLETPPPTPGFKQESKLELLTKERAELENEREELEKSISSKLEEIAAVRGDTIVMESKKTLYDDTLEVARRSQVAVRDLLNEIYNPGQQIAQEAAALFEESKRGSFKRLEKLEFDLKHQFESTRAVIGKKMKEVTHHIELTQRTLLTLECQHGVKQSLAVEKDEEMDVQVTENSVIQEKIKSEEKGCSPLADDDCIILSDNSVDSARASTRGSGQTPDGQPLQNGGFSGNNSTETNATADEDEETDIEDVKDEERPFTPCQAQRSK